LDAECATLVRQDAAMSVDNLPAAEPSKNSGSPEFDFSDVDANIGTLSKEDIVSAAEAKAFAED